MKSSVRVNAIRTQRFVRLFLSIGLWFGWRSTQRLGLETCSVCRVIGVYVNEFDPLIASKICSRR